MSTVSTAGPRTPTQRFPAWFAVASGLAGLLSFGCLMLYLFTPGFLMSDSGAISRGARLLLNTDFIAAMLQVLFLLPLTRRIARMTRLSPVVHIAGVAGFCLVAVCRVLPNRPSRGVGHLVYGANRAGGNLAADCEPVDAGSHFKRSGDPGNGCGSFLIGVALNFVFNGGLAVFTQGPFAYGNNVLFHIGLALTGAPAFTLFQLWSILTGIQLLKIARKYE